MFSSPANVRKDKFSNALRGQRMNEQIETKLTLADVTSSTNQKFADDWEAGENHREKDFGFKKAEGNKDRGDDDVRNNDRDDDMNKNDINDQDGEHGNDEKDEERNDGDDESGDDENGDDENGDDENGDVENGNDKSGDDENAREKKVNDEIKTESKDEEKEKGGNEKDSNSERKKEKEHLIEEAKTHLLLNENVKKKDKEMIEYQEKLIQELKTRLHNAESELVKTKEQQEERDNRIKRIQNFDNIHARDDFVGEFESTRKKFHRVNHRHNAKELDVYEKHALHRERKGPKKYDDINEKVYHDHYFFDLAESISLPFAIDQSTKNQFAFSVWLYLPAHSDKVSRSILTTKGAGCEAFKSDEKNGGISLYINLKETENHALLLDYMTTKGCKTIQSLGRPVPYNEWIHVGVTVMNDGATTLKLFLNGEVVEDVKEPIKLNQSIQEETRLGELFEHDEPLIGSLANLVIWKDQIVDENAMKQIYQIGMDKKRIIHDHSIGDKKNEFNFFYPLDKNNVEEEKIQSLSARKISNLSSKPTLIKAVTDISLIDPNWKPLGPDRYSEYKDGSNTFVLTPEIKLESDEKARKRRSAVRNAMIHAWNGYKTYAWGQDELVPISRKGRNNWGGLGTTLVDALDTLWLMDLKDEFWEARDWVRDHLKQNTSKKVSTFETAIRNLGGLLAAYDLSGDEAFYEKAEELGKKLSFAFHSPTGIAFESVSLAIEDASNRRGASTVIAEAGTLQVEFRHLAKITGQDKYAKDSEKFFARMRDIQPKDTGLFPYLINNMSNGKDFLNSHITFGAFGDSFYEYMLKIWLQGGKKESMYRDMYDKAMDGLHDNLLFKTNSGLTYIAEHEFNKVLHKMDHLVCFMGGLLALGAYTHPDGLESPKAQRDLKTGKALTYTCYQMYASTETGLGPEIVRIAGGIMQPMTKTYLLRPEAIESFFILYHLTGDPVYREWGWEVFQAIERYCKTEAGYSAIRNVNTPYSYLDGMESFFLAETLKYSYLLQDPDTEIDLLNKHVFNTEAHPLRLLDKVKRDHT